MSHYVEPEPSKKRSAQFEFRDMEIHYVCVPKSQVEALLHEHEVYETNDRWFSSSHHCPADPKKEPIVRERFDSGAKVTLEMASQYFSQYFDHEFANFSVVPWAVDRSMSQSILLLTPLNLIFSRVLLYNGREAF